MAFALRTHQLLLIPKVVSILTGPGLLASAELIKDTWPFLLYKCTKLLGRRDRASLHIGDTTKYAELQVVQRITVLILSDSGPPSCAIVALILCDNNTHYFLQWNLEGIKRRKDGGLIRSSHLHHDTVTSIEN
jgi:hypothetical protein